MYGPAFCFVPNSMLRVFCKGLLGAERVVLGKRDRPTRIFVHNLFQAKKRTVIRPRIKVLAFDVHAAVR